MDNVVKKEEKHDCGCKCGFEHILPKIMKFGLGEIIAFIAIVLFFLMSSFPDGSLKSFYVFLMSFSRFAFTLFLILFFAEKFTCFYSKFLKWINTILLGLSTICFVILVIKGWSYAFDIESLILFILILAANAYWAYDIIMGFVAKQQESAAMAKPVEEKVVEPEKKEEPKETEEKPEEKEETEDKPEESEEETKED